jgi:hypothetical protein
VDATTFRWVLIFIALLLGVGIYFYGAQQSRLRKRNAIETFTREEIDSAFIEDEQLRDELDNLNQILNDNESLDEIDRIEINPAGETQSTPFALPDPEIFVPALILKSSPERFISHMLRHDDFRLITGEEADNAVKHTGLVTNDDGYLIDPDQDTESFQISSLSTPGHFHEVEQLDFATLGFNCFIDLETCEEPGQAYEAMLKKIDELVRTLNVKVFKPGQELLTISDVTSVREKLG